MTASRVRAIATTIVLWAYFLGAFLLGGFALFLLAGIARGRRGLSWALATYTRGFLFVLRAVIPGLRIRLPERGTLHALRGTVVVCNHLSFLDPLLMLAALPRPSTIVRRNFFRVPIFGWLLRGCGFLGPELFAQGRPWMDRVAHHLRGGGNLLVFPEGRRSRDGDLGPFKKGAFYLAKHLSAPILVVRIDGTGQVFAPGRFLFDVTPNRRIEVQARACITSARAAEYTTQELTTHVRAMLEPDAQHESVS